MGLRKEFLKPTDYEIGLTYSDIKAKRYMIEQDTSLLVKERNLDVWGGYSHYLARDQIERLSLGTLQLPGA